MPDVLNGARVEGGIPDFHFQFFFATSIA